MAAAPTTSTDEDIERDVLTELAWDAELEPNEIGVTAKDGVVRLTGRVDRFNKRWAAERATLRVQGVRAVANDLEVRLPAGDERTDVELANATVQALEWNNNIPVQAVQVSASDG
jgi:osmotically-inducible protein OsmY